MFVIYNVMTGAYLSRAGSWVKNKRGALRFVRYVDAFNARPLGGVIRED